MSAFIILKAAAYALHLSIIEFLKWFRPYVKDLSKKKYHLTDKTNKNAKLTWENIDINTVKTLIDEIKN